MLTNGAKDAGDDSTVRSILTQSPQPDRNNMAYAQGPKLNVKDAVAAVQEFVGALYGADTLRYAAVEEIEYFPEPAEWLVTLSFNTPANVILNAQRRDLKTFRVDEASGKVLSMRIKSQA